MTMKEAVRTAEYHATLWVSWAKAIGSMTFILTTPALLVLVWKLL